MVARRAVSVSRVRDLPRNFNEKVIVKNKSITISIVFIIIDHRKGIKPLECDEHFEVFYMVDKSINHEKLLSIC